MKTLMNKKGMGLPMVLGITVFIIGLSATLMSYIVFQSRIVDIDIDETEIYQNSVSNVNAALNIMARNQDMYEVDGWIQSLENRLNVTIEEKNNTFIITSMIDESNRVISYMSTSSSQASINDILFNDNGQEIDFTLITPQLLLTDFIPTFITEILGLSVDQDDIKNFDDLMDYLDDLPEDMDIQEISQSTLERAKTPKITEDSYVDDDVKLDKDKTFIIENGSMLFIDGDLELEKDSAMIIKDQSIIYVDDQFKIAQNSELNIEVGSMLFVNDDFEIDKDSKIYGNVIVNGDAKIEKDTIFEGTIYVNGDLTIESDVQLGTSSRPTFIFVDGDINIKKDTHGYAYIMGDDINIEKDVTIIGGVYAHGELKIDDKGIIIQEGDELDLLKLFDYAVPSQISVPSEDGDSSGDSDYIITYPKLN